MSEEFSTKNMTIKCTEIYQGYNFLTMKSIKITNTGIIMEVGKSEYIKFDEPIITGDIND